jgi:hypothetical protein
VVYALKQEEKSTGFLLVELWLCNAHNYGCHRPFKSSCKILAFRADAKACQAVIEKEGYNALGQDVYVQKKVCRRLMMEYAKIQVEFQVKPKVIRTFRVDTGAQDLSCEADDTGAQDLPCKADDTGAQDRSCKAEGAQNIDEVVGLPKKTKWVDAKVDEEDLKGKDDKGLWLQILDMIPHTSLGEPLEEYVTTAKDKKTYYGNSDGVDDGGGGFTESPTDHDDRKYWAEKQEERALELYGFLPDYFVDESGQHWPEGYPELDFHDSEEDEYDYDHNKLNIVAACTCSIDPSPIGRPAEEEASRAMIAAMTQKRMTTITPITSLTC